LLKLPFFNAAVRWGKHGARINTISPGIIITPLAKDELTGPRGEGYRRMIERSPAKRAGTPDEVGNFGALIMGPDGGFVTGSDFLMDGGVSAAYWYGGLLRAEPRPSSKHIKETNDDTGHRRQSRRHHGSQQRPWRGGGTSPQGGVVGCTSTRTGTRIALLLGK
jgi:Enoyl-(Acyl carrier protein) reductase